MKPFHSPDPISIRNDEFKLPRAVTRIRSKARRIASGSKVSRSGSERELIPLKNIAAVLSDGNTPRLVCPRQEDPDRRAFSEWVELLEATKNA